MLRYTLTSNKGLALFIFIGMLLSFGCSTQTCNKNEIKPRQMNSNLSSKVGMSDQLQKRVKISKPDGTLQCQQGQEITLETMSKELKDIKIFSSEKKHDGLMRIQVCGQPTGQNNVYEIAESDLEAATKLGFKRWKND